MRNIFLNEKRAREGTTFADRTTITVDFETNAAGIAPVSQTEK
jgi:hypothetical protein